MMTLHGAKGLEFQKVYICGMEEGLFPSYASINADKPEEEIEEERRLCYVGMTRAKKELFMSSARERMTNGETHYTTPSRFIDELPPDGVEFFRRKRRAASWEDADDDYDQPIPKRGFRKKISFADEFGGFGSGSGSSFSDAENTARGFTGTFGSLDKTPAGKKKASLADYVKASSLTKEKPDYQTGDTVLHTKYGRGTVLDILEKPKDYEVTVDFEGFGVKRMLAAFAKLKKTE